eukprot:385825_1
MGVCSSCSSIPEASVMIIGLDGAGKTTILKQLNKEPCDKTLPTMGFNVNKVEFEGLEMTIWDVGGQERLRSVWKHYYNEVQAIVFVVDSNDRDRIFGKHAKDDDCVKFWIDLIANNSQLNDCIFLILANKQDQDQALTTNQVIDALDLCGKFRKRVWHVHPTIAIQNEGIDEAFRWLSSMLQKQKKGK